MSDTAFEIAKLIQMGCENYWDFVMLLVLQQGLSGVVIIAPLCSLLNIDFDHFAAEAPPGVEVWVGNLPRKRKVERDLNSVFKSAPGLLHIRPILDPDNEKTRDPICKGFAFLTFATDDDADK